MRLAGIMVAGLAATIAWRAEVAKVPKIVDFICAIFPVIHRIHASDKDKHCITSPPCPAACTVQVPELPLASTLANSQRPVRASVLEPAYLL